MTTGKMIKIHVGCIPSEMSTVEKKYIQLTIEKNHTIKKIIQGAKRTQSQD